MNLNMTHITMMTMTNYSDDIHFAWSGRKGKGISLLYRNNQYRNDNKIYFEVDPAWKMVNAGVEDRVGHNLPTAITSQCDPIGIAVVSEEETDPPQSAIAVTSPPSEMQHSTSWGAVRIVWKCQLL
jgi:hypothetical protein